MEELFLDKFTPPQKPQHPDATIGSEERVENAKKEALAMWRKKRDKYVDQGNARGVEECEKNIAQIKSSGTSV